MQKTTRRTPLRASRASWSSTNGRPATGISAFGRSAVRLPRRVARPPARIATGTSDSFTGPDGRWRGRSLDHDLGALEVEAEANLAQAGPEHRVPQSDLV